MTTLRDVASDAGVSQMTVSNVVNGRHEKVSAATIARVQESIARLGYVPNASARALSAKSSSIIALVYQSVDEGVHALSNPHDSVFVGEVERRVSSSGRYLMIQSARDVVSTAANLRTWNVDGAIFLGTFGHEVDALRDQFDVPMVFVDNYSRSPRVSNIGVDDFGGGYVAATQLLYAGHRSFAFVSPEFGDEGVVRQRYDGFLAALRERGIKRVPTMIQTATTFEDGFAVAQSLVKRRSKATGVFATADIIAIGMLKGFASLDVRVPDDVSIIGFDDLPECQHVTPALSTIRQDVPAKAHSAVEVLERLITAGPTAPAERLTLEVHYTARDTVSPR